jgi:hypothetical protein
MLRLYADARYFTGKIRDMSNKKLEGNQVKQRITHKAAPGK